MTSEFKDSTLIDFKKNEMLEDALAVDRQLVKMGKYCF